MSIVYIPTLPEQKHHVYALLCQDEGGPGYVKFGMSRDVESRLSSLRTSCPVKAKYLAVIDVGKKERAMLVERALHEKFADRRKTGEWFGFDFSSPKDKADFNTGCREVFAWHLIDRPERWWTKISIAAFDADQQARMMESVRTRKPKKKRSPTWREDRAKRVADEERQAWAELQGFHSKSLYR